MGFLGGTATARPRPHLWNVDLGLAAVRLHAEKAQPPSLVDRLILGHATVHKPHG